MLNGSKHALLGTLTLQVFFDAKSMREFLALDEATGMQ
jgi:hypothetical protein